MKKIKGFTLIELLVTIAILGVIAMIAVPSLSNALSQRRFESSFQSLTMVFSNARNQALTLRQNVEVKLNSDSVDTTTVLNWSPTTGSGVSLGTDSVASVIFQPTGAIQNFDATNMTFTLCNSKLQKTKSLQLTRMGSVTLLEEGTC